MGKLELDYVCVCLYFEYRTLSKWDLGPHLYFGYFSVKLKKLQSKNNSHGEYCLVKIQSKIRVF